MLSSLFDWIITVPEIRGDLLVLVSNFEVQVAWFWCIRFKIVGFPQDEGRGKSKKKLSVNKIFVLVAVKHIFVPTFFCFHHNCLMSVHHSDDDDDNEKKFHSKLYQLDTTCISKCWMEMYLFIMKRISLKQFKFKKVLN